MSHLEEKKIVVLYSDIKTASDNDKEFQLWLVFFKAFPGAVTKDTIIPGYHVMKLLKILV